MSIPKTVFVLFFLFTFLPPRSLSFPAPLKSALRQGFETTCTTDDDCGTDFSCLGTPDLCAGDLCACLPNAGLTDLRCDSNSDCDSGSSCVEAGIVSICISNDLITEMDDSCIDASALHQIPAHELVFAKHRHATVLCDRAGSCATRGHMVIWQGNPMMMRSYCALEPCTTKTMLVNSPRWKRALRLPSNTPGLHYLAFAARYETRAEERVMQVAVRMGM